MQALSAGHMPHKLGVLGFHVYVQRVHLQWNEIEQGPSLVSPQYNSVPIEPFKGRLGVPPYNI